MSRPITSSSLSTQVVHTEEVGSTQASELLYSLQLRQLARCFLLNWFLFRGVVLQVQLAVAWRPRRPAGARPTNSPSPSNNTWTSAVVLRVIVTELQRRQGRYRTLEQSIARAGIRVRATSFSPSLDQTHSQSQLCRRHAGAAGACGSLAYLQRCRQRRVSLTGASCWERRLWRPSIPQNAPVAPSPYTYCCDNCQRPLPPSPTKLLLRAHPHRTLPPSLPPSLPHEPSKIPDAARCVTPTLDGAHGCKIFLTQCGIAGACYSATGLLPTLRCRRRRRLPPTPPLPSSSSSFSILLIDSLSLHLVVDGRVRAQPSGASRRCTLPCFHDFGHACVQTYIHDARVETLTHGHRDTDTDTRT